MTNHKKRYKYIIWDWNGTLVDDVWLCVEALNLVLKKRNMPLVNRQRYITEFSHPVREYYQKLGFDLSSESFESLVAEFNAAYNNGKDRCALQPSAERMLGLCTKAGFFQVLLSAYQQKKLRQAVRYFNLHNHFAAICGLDDFNACSKIQTAITMAEQLQLNNTETLLIGDTIHDYEVAQAIECDCVLIENGHNSRDILQSCGATVVESLAELEKVLI